jgi:opacity protein-like surface antigen
MRFGTAISADGWKSISDQNRGLFCISKEAPKYTVFSVCFFPRHMRLPFFDPFTSLISHSPLLTGRCRMICGRFSTVWMIAWVIALLLSAKSEPAIAQENPIAEVYLGYAGLIGFNGSAAYNVNRWFGVVGDYSYRVAEYYADKPLQTFTAGPRVTLRLIPRLTPFAHVLFGGAGSGCASFSDTSGCQFGTASATVFGGGLDIQINKNLTIRAIQIDKIRASFGDHADTYTGASFGLVARIGKLSR